ncbi:MAG: hypothetical protein DCF20_13810 [Pseudanabaena sp.]|nr:MAG: hypothetical protein DCF20_13810 [Pseudanabaena sp.]
MTLVKAMLTTTDAGAEPINFQFNPSSLTIARKVKWNSEGSRAGGGLPKLSYSHREPVTLKLQDLWFDTYENATEKSVLDLIGPIIQATEVVESLKRPPVFILAWGDKTYLRCVVTDISYELTMFLANGTPVRAKVSIDLHEVAAVDVAT